MPLDSHDILKYGTLAGLAAAAAYKLHKIHKKKKLENKYLGKSNTVNKDRANEESVDDYVNLILSRQQDQK